jgi:hypothetical protein
MSSPEERAKFSKMGKDAVSSWLCSNEIRIYASEFQAHEVDGKALLGLIDLWKADKAGFLKHARDSLGIDTAGHALRLASMLQDVTFDGVEKAVSKN